MWDRCLAVCFDRNKCKGSGEAVGDAHCAQSLSQRPAELSIHMHYGRTEHEIFLFQVGKGELKVVSFEKAARASGVCRETHFKMNAWKIHHVKSQRRIENKKNSAAVPFHFPPFTSSKCANFVASLYLYRRTGSRILPRTIHHDWLFNHDAEPGAPAPVKESPRRRCFLGLLLHWTRFPEIPDSIFRQSKLPCDSHPKAQSWEDHAVLLQEGQPAALMPGAVQGCCIYPKSGETDTTKQGKCLNDTVPQATSILGLRMTITCVIKTYINARIIIYPSLMHFLE